jgi:hypothetical protein
LLRLFYKRAGKGGKSFTSTAGSQVQGVDKIKQVSDLTYREKIGGMSTRLIFFLTKTDLNGNPFSIIHNSGVHGTAEIIFMTL